MKRIALSLLLAVMTSSVFAEERTYPSLPDAMTKRPAWLVNAPFDVDEYFKSPPAEQNAAPLYLDALFEFNSDMAVCFHPKDEKPQGEVKRRADAAKKRFEEYLKFEQLLEENPKPVDNDAVDRWLAEYETGFQKLAAAQKRPECVFESGMRIESPLPTLQAVRQVARVVKWRARRALARQNLERPIQDLEILLRLTRDYQNRGSTLGQLVSMALETMYYEETLASILQAGNLKKVHCDRLLALLNQQEPAVQQRFLESVKGEYLWARIMMHDLQHRKGDFAEKPKKDLGDRKTTDFPKDHINLFFCFGPSRLVQEKYGEKPSDLPSDHPFIAGWVIDGKIMTDDDFAKEIAALNQAYTSALKLADKTPRERLDVIREGKIFEPLRATKIALFFEPIPENIAQVLLHRETELQAMKCLVALRRWQIDHDKPPRDLETMVKEAGLERVPIDPYSNKPMKMTILDGEPVIYSIGPDGKDDHARKECKHYGKDKTGDIVFHLSTKSGSY